MKLRPWHVLTLAFLILLSMAVGFMLTLSAVFPDPATTL